MTLDRAATSRETDQGSVLGFLARAEPGMRRVDTHASIVFLGKDRVLKVKRAVRLPFLDYSTREKRKHACEEELKVNTPFAPDLYRRVVPITRGEAALPSMAKARRWSGRSRWQDLTRRLASIAL